MQTELNHLPESAKRLIALVGIHNALRIVDRFGGKTLRLYPTGEAIARVVNVVGQDGAEKLLAYFGSDPFIVPKCTDAVEAVRNAKIHAEFDRMTMVEKRSGRESIHILVDMVDLSERQIQRILKKGTTVMPKVAEVDPRQMSLL